MTAASIGALSGIPRESPVLESMQLELAATTSDPRASSFTHNANLPSELVNASVSPGSWTKLVLASWNTLHATRCPVENATPRTSRSPGSVAVGVGVSPSGGVKKGGVAKVTVGVAVAVSGRP